ncbi:hypothetical protein F5878DRAFT_264414 [Lentinula raphanica]|uniref:Uncharacterized protein n=1 Tax=Lentinula raphanica TaxID=153919 RepID=A0AA38P575_9AGAR|nr:hypothetical protein F5878DRAFT_264414 [Lentinula raphanica]
MVHFRTIGILVIATMFIHAAPLDSGSLSAQNNALPQAPTSHSGGPTRDLLEDGLKDVDVVKLPCESSLAMKKSYVDVIRRGEEKKVHFLGDDCVVAGYSKTPPPISRTPSPTPEKKEFEKHMEKLKPVKLPPEVLKERIDSSLSFAEQLEGLHQGLAASLRRRPTHADDHSRVSKPKRRLSTSGSISSSSSRSISRSSSSSSNSCSSCSSEL